MQRVHPAARCGQVLAAEAQIPRRRQRRVVEVVRADHPVVVGVDAVEPPGLRDELHRPHRPGVDRVAVQRLLAVDDLEVAVGAVETHAADRRADVAVGRDRRPAVGAVVALDHADTGQRRPGQVAVRVLHLGHPRRVRVGLQRLIGMPSAGARSRCPLVQLVGGPALGVGVDRGHRIACGGAAHPPGSGCPAATSSWRPSSIAAAATTAPARSQRDDDTATPRTHFWFLHRPTGQASLAPGKSGNGGGNVITVSLLR